MGFRVVVATDEVENEFISDNADELVARAEAWGDAEKYAKAQKVVALGELAAKGDKERPLAQ